MKKKRLHIAMWLSAFIFFIGISNTHAESIQFNFNLRSTGYDWDWQIPGSSDYKYAVLEFPATAGARTTIAFYEGRNGILSNPYKLGNSANFALKSKNKVYILPKSGMSCPSDATYCFGAGRYFSSTTIISPGNNAYTISFDGGDAGYSGTIRYYT